MKLPTDKEVMSIIPIDWRQTERDLWFDGATWMRDKYAKPLQNRINEHEMREDLLKKDFYKINSENVKLNSALDVARDVIRCRPSYCELNDRCNQCVALAKIESILKGEK